GDRPRALERGGFGVRGEWLHALAVGGGPVPLESDGDGDLPDALAVSHQRGRPALGGGRSAAPVQRFLLLPAATNHPGAPLVGRPGRGLESWPAALCAACARGARGGGGGRLRDGGVDL